MTLCGIIVTQVKSVQVRCSSASVISPAKLHVIDGRLRMEAVEAVVEVCEPDSFSGSVADVIAEEQAVELFEEADKSFLPYDMDIWNF